MYYANDNPTTKNRIKAEPSLQGFCPLCDDQLIPRCGLINRPHWAHKNLTEDCDRWAEGETDWHLDWKDRVARKDKNRVEVRMGSHRADAVARDGTIIELQHSPIDIPTLIERQEFYKKLIWVLDCRYYKIRNTIKNLSDIFYVDETSHIEFNQNRKNDNSYVNFYWKYPKKSFNYYSTARFQKQFFPVLLDIGVAADGQEYLFLIRNVRTIDHWTGWGVLMTYDDFIWRVNESTNLMLALKTYNPLLSNSKPKAAVQPAV